MHLVSFEAALVLGTLLIVDAGGAGRTALAAIYAASVAGMFGASALYHRGAWAPATAARLQRLDHLMIFVVIAGTATPPMALCLPSPYSWLAVSLMWSLTAIAATLRLIRMQVPEWLAGAIFVGLGWSAGAAVPAVWIRAGVAPAVLMIAGGVLYTVGALAYHRRRPDPIPELFGYHEVFHAFVSLAAACQYVAIACFIF
jgi:hemolysin III